MQDGPVVLGLDLGTSALKAVLMAGPDRILARASVALSVERPHPGWSEQDPAAWWGAVEAAVRSLQGAAPMPFAALAAIGIAGQMHGAVALDGAHRPLRPAILWNDGRAVAEAAWLAETFDVSRITGNLSMPGFTAPKLIWMQRHEPELFRRIGLVLLPKDFLRLKLCGEAASDMSDASGTLWLDVGARAWSAPLVATCGMEVEQLPRLLESPNISGRLRRPLADAWGVAEVPVVAGAGDNAAAALSLGIRGPDRAFLSIGTSGVYFRPTATFEPAPDRAIHTFCHALPGLWHQMAVTLSAGDALSWAAEVLGASPQKLLAEAGRASPAAERGLWFQPYLSGERTPHNEVLLRGGWIGLDRACGRGDLARAVLEGVALSLADASEPLRQGCDHRLALIGGGAQSQLWSQIVADALDREVDLINDPDAGPAKGAARLALCVLTSQHDDIFGPPPVKETRAPRTPVAAHLTEFRQLPLHHAPR